MESNKKSAVYIEPEDIEISDCLIIHNNEFTMYVDEGVDKENQKYKVHFLNNHSINQGIKWYEFKKWFRTFRTVYRYLIV